jgi:hypothetical protein
VELEFAEGTSQCPIPDPHGAGPMQIFVPTPMGHLPVFLPPYTPQLFTPDEIWLVHELTS